MRAGTIRAGEPVCVAEGLSVGYRSGRRCTAVLDGLDLELTSGSFTCLLGPNGSGKSTLLRTFAGMQRPLGGKLTLFGEDIARLRPRQLARRLGVVLTDRVTVGALSVTDLVELGRYPHRGWDGRPGENDAAIVQWAIDITGTQPLAHRDVDELSDGERQRVMIARALAQEPAMLLLDEPTAYLDVSRRVELTALLRSLAAETGKAVLCTTHDLELALRAADRIWLLDPDGTVIEGAPRTSPSTDPSAPASPARESTSTPTPGVCGCGARSAAGCMWWAMTGPRCGRPERWSGPATRSRTATGTGALRSRCGAGQVPAGRSRSTAGAAIITSWRISSGACPEVNLPTSRLCRAGFYGLTGQDTERCLRYCFNCQSNAFDNAIGRGCATFFFEYTSTLTAM
ncbi:MAG: ABC transporter ATP-binding protein [Pseudonocardiaceae bacterium]